MTEPVRQIAPRKQCSIDGCSRAHEARGWCRTHYRRWQKHGDPLAGGPAIKDNNPAQRFLAEVVLRHSGNKCLIWPFHRDSKNGYGQVWNGAKLTWAHRYVCEKVHGPAPDPELEAAHSCGNGHLGCVNPNHLRWATRSENALDRAIHGTDIRGKKNHSAVLNEHQVQEIRSLRGVVSQGELARRFGVDRMTIKAIYTGRSWAWLPPLKEAS